MEMKQKSCLCYNHLLGQNSQFNNLMSLEVIFKNYRASFAKKETLTNQIVEANNILKSSSSVEEKQMKLFEIFRKESPLLKIVNVLVKLGNPIFLDFSSSILKLMLKTFSNPNSLQKLDAIEVYQGLYLSEDLQESLEKYFIKGEYMFFNSVNLLVFHGKCKTKSSPKR